MRRINLLYMKEALIRLYNYEFCIMNYEFFTASPIAFPKL